MSKAEDLAKHLLLTTEEMASQCSAPFTLWNEHSNAARTAAAMIRQQAARITALEEANAALEAKATTGLITSKGVIG